MLPILNGKILTLLLKIPILKGYNYRFSFCINDYNMYFSTLKPYLNNGFYFFEIMVKTPTPIL